MTRVAAYDCGTNSLRLLVAEVNPSSTDPTSTAPAVTQIDRRMELVRLGEGVDETGRLSEAALERTFAATARCAEVARELGATRTRFVATSATRDAQNKGEFLAGIHEILGVEPEVVSGEQEAKLSFAGATAELIGGPIAGPYLVVDIGGGSTEFIYGTDRATHAHSLNIGSVRLAERLSLSDPPTAAQWAQATEMIDSALTQAEQR
ncbi:MAG: Ppx/GppA phosphatase family protein, partial [Angustibacter sp.]